MFERKPDKAEAIKKLKQHVLIFGVWRWRRLEPRLTFFTICPVRRMSSSWNFYRVFGSKLKLDLEKRWIYQAA
uniref:Uncharacterized protein n=1 Tax=Kalanchoe fedtschenkoi TaxID=63787 RepID=A0A7N0ZTM1_KALFE